MLSQFPDSPEASKSLLNLGYIKIALSDKSEAIKYFQKVQDKYPDSPEASEASLRHGNLLFSLNDYDNSIGQYNKVKTGTPLHSNAILMLGKAYEKKGNIIQSMTCYARDIELYPNADPTAEAKKCMAELYMNHKTISYPENINKYIPNALQLAGTVCLKNPAERDKSIIYFKQVLDNYNNYEYYDDCIMLLGRAYVRTSQYEEGKKAFHRIINEFGHTNHANEAAMELVRIAWDTNNWEEMIESSALLQKFPHPRGKLYALYAAVEAYQNTGRKLDPIKSQIETILHSPDISREYKAEFAHLLDLLNIGNEQISQTNFPHPNFMDKSIPEWDSKVANTMLGKSIEKGDKSKTFQIGSYIFHSTNNLMRKYQIIYALNSMSSSTNEQYQKDLDELRKEFQVLAEPFIENNNNDLNERQYIAAGLADIYDIHGFKEKSGALRNKFGILKQIPPPMDDEKLSTFFIYQEDH